MNTDFPDFPKKFDAPHHVVPDAYFKNLESRLKAIPSQKPGAKKLIVRWLWLPAVAATLLALMWIWTPNTPTESTHWPAEDVILWMNELQLSSLYLMEDFEEIETAELWESTDWEQDYLEWQEQLSQQEFEF